MAGQAHITSHAAIESFRAALIVFLGKVRPLLEEVSTEIVRTRQWLQNDQRRRWENEVRVCLRRLEESKAELFSGMLSKIQETTALQQMAVTRAQQAVRENEGKLKIVKKWDRELENRTDPFIKQVELLHTFLATDMARAITHLDQTIQALEAYATAPRGGEKQDSPA